MTAATIANVPPIQSVRLESGMTSPFLLLLLLTRLGTPEFRPESGIRPGSGLGPTVRKNNCADDKNQERPHAIYDVPRAAEVPVPPFRERFGSYLFLCRPSP
jgi:hypothetical protein